MYLNYAKIDSSQKKPPMLRLRTLAGRELGPIPFAHDLKFAINYSELSTIEFTVPYKVDGKISPLYNDLAGFKVVYTEDLGVYVLKSPTTANEGIEESKTVKGYSLECLFANKDLFLEEGTYNFWNPADGGETILGRILELDSQWRAGFVAPRLIGCYRTFDQYDSDALSFCYGDAMEKFRCAFVFDVYEKTVNVYDAMEDAETLPIYLSFDNLVESSSVDELSDDVATKLRLMGSDGLTVRDVNPTGKDYIVDLDYFLYNGDLDIKVGDSGVTLADRVRAWQASIAARQTYYAGLVSARASLTAQKLTADVELTEKRGELDTLKVQQSVIIQAMALETSAEGKARQQAALDDINAQIDGKTQEIQDQEERISAIEAEIEQYMETLGAINRELSFEGYFTAGEQEILSRYMIEASVTDETFVATDAGASVDGATSTVSGKVALTDSAVTRVEIPDSGKTMYVIAGGDLNVPGARLSAFVMRGTLEAMSGDRFVLTAHLGDTTYGEHTFQSGLITVAGALSGLSTDVAAHTENEATEYTGTRLEFETTDASTYFTVSTNDFQKYSVEMELYDFGMEVLDDYAWPVYEFNVNSANFLYHEKFEPFKNKLELGKAVRLELGSEGRVNAKIIGVELNFEDLSSFSLVFSNRYQKKNGMEDWLEEVRSASRAGRSIDAKKYTYNRAADKVTEVSELMRQQLVAAVNNIVNAEDQTVRIDRSGINIGGNSKYQMRMVDNMIAMTDDGWKTAKLALGLFATENLGTHWGVNTELLAGNLIIGNNLVLQNPTDDGVMQFMVDSTGAWLYNSRHVLQSDNGLIVVDPRFGIAAGTKLLLDTNGTRVTPEFLDEAGDITLDAQGMPKNANFWLDVRTGNAYFRGTVYAENGVFNGTVYARDGEFTGKVTATSGEFNGTVNATGGEFNGVVHATGGEFTGTVHATDGEFTGTVHATDGEFNGTVHATGGEFKGTVQALKYLDANGNDMMANGKFKDAYLDLSDVNGNITQFKTDIGDLKSYMADDKGRWSAIEQTVEEIQTDVSGLGGQYSQLSQAVSGFNTTVNALDGRITTAQQTADKVGWIIASGTSSTNFELTSRMAKLVADKIDLTGYVTINSLKTAGSTTINGSNITTGTISASRINLSGAITWGDLNSTVQSEINNRGISSATATTLITDKLVSSPTIEGASISGGSISGSNIFGGRFYDTGRTVMMRLDKESFVVMNTEGTVPSDIIVVSQNSDGTYGLTIGGALCFNAKYVGNTIKPQGTWNFADATVTGLKIA